MLIACGQAETSADKAMEITDNNVMNFAEDGLDKQVNLQSKKGKTPIKVCRNICYTRYQRCLKNPGKFGLDMCDTSYQACINTCAVNYN